jgi:hypothetical protein
MVKVALPDKLGFGAAVDQLTTNESLPVTVIDVADALAENVRSSAVQVAPSNAPFLENIEPSLRLLLSSPVALIAILLPARLRGFYQFS